MFSGPESLALGHSDGKLTLHTQDAGNAKMVWTMDAQGFITNKSAKKLLTPRKIWTANMTNLGRPWKGNYTDLQLQNKYAAYNHKDPSNSQCDLSQRFYMDDKHLVSVGSLNGYISILLVSYSMCSAALESSSVLLSYLISSLAHHISIILISTLF